MSVIEKLTIQGIRSFGTKPDDVQSITFTAPLTLILGENGCGKTTIIECLKYALTGEAPPGSNRGHSFVHDPKVFNFSESLGQIKLMVRNIRQESITVCRSMKLGYKYGKPSFETLDATMNYMSSDNNKGASISKRCVDVDTAMCEFMDVSKAIINNVIFCHQEDSNWPLDEPKKLKDKFDAIFGVCEYNNAIEKFIKLRKEQMDELKLKEANLKYFSHLKVEMEDKTMSLKRAQEKCDNIKALCGECEIEVKPIEKRLSEIQNVEFEVGKYQAMKVELETKKQNCEEHYLSLEKIIKTPFVGSILELDREIQMFDEKMLKKKNVQCEMEENLLSLKEQESRAQKVFIEMDKKRYTVIQQRQREQECIAERDENIKTLSQEMCLPMENDLNNCSGNICDLLELIDNALKREQYKMDETIREHDRQDHDLQMKCDVLRVDLTKTEEGIRTWQEQREQHEKEYRSTERHILEIEATVNRLKQISSEIEHVSKSYDQFVDNMKQNELKESIAKGRRKVIKLQEQFRQFDERITFFNSISKSLAEISLMEKEVEKKEQEVQRVKNKHINNIKTIVGRPLERNYRRNIQIFYENFRRQIKDINEKLNALNLKQQSLVIKRKNLKEKIVNAEKNLEESKDNVYEICRTTAYDEVFIKCKESLLRYQLEHGALKSSELTYKKYILKIEEDPCCPLCHKGLSDNESVELKLELTDEIHHLPDNIKCAEKFLKAEQKKYDRLLQLKPVIEKIAQLEIDIPLQKEELNGIDAQLVEYTNDMESLEMALVEPASKMDTANEILGDMSILDECLKEIMRLNGDIDNLKNKLPQNVGGNSDMDDLLLQKAAVSGELESERAHLDKWQADYEEGVDVLNKLREKRNNLKDEQMKLHEGVQNLPQLKNRQVELPKLIATSTNKLRALRQKITTQEQKLNDIIKEKVALKETNRGKIATMQSSHDLHKKMHNNLQRLDGEVNEYGKMNLLSEIETLKVSMKQSRNVINEKSSAIAELSKCLEAIKAERHNQETLKRDLKDNREMKILEQNRKDLNGQYEKLVRLLGGLNFKDVSKEKEELKRKSEAITIRKHELLGQVGEINSQIKKLTKEINEPTYKDSLQNYRRLFYEVEVAKRMIVDLGLYRTALEKSLIQFHSDKMEKINSLIREYWRQIYRGNDIDYIQIRTDEGRAESTGERKRNYSYCVMQSKNSTEIEMRGRCSAGQQVLASLIIRMALAETFSRNCGVLALDEPTTNLDRINILSLCEALNRIVQERQFQSNFMLIIITHDEDFIQTIGKVNSYHRVFRDQDGKSAIRKVKII